MSAYRHVFYEHPEALARKIQVTLLAYPNFFDEFHYVPLKDKGLVHGFASVIAIVRAFYMFETPFDTLRSRLARFRAGGIHRRDLPEPERPLQVPL